MLNTITTFTETLNLASTTTSISYSTGTFMLCSALSLGLGAVIAFTFSFKQQKTKSFTTALALLPIIVQVIIMLVNGNLGTGVAVAGAFSLVRFRSMPGSAKDILGIFLAMAVGLATGTNHILLSVLFTAIVCAAYAIYMLLPIGQAKGSEKVLTVTIPESLDYGDVFDDIFKKFTNRAELESVKTTNMGSLFKLKYDIELKNGVGEKELIDELRVRNGNLEITCAKKMIDTERAL